MRNMFFYTSIVYCLLGVQESLADTILTRNIAVTLAESKIDSNGKLEIHGEYDEIEEHAFDGIEKLKEVSISGIKKIGDFAFANCSNLKSVQINRGRYYAQPVSFGKAVFKNCSSLSEISWKRIKNISEEMFSNCLALETLELPIDLERIEKHSFYGCTRLKSINNSSTDWSKMKIDPFTFCGCPNIKHITISKKIHVDTRPGYVHQFLNIICQSEGRQRIDGFVYDEIRSFPKEVIVKDDGKIITNSKTLVKCLDESGFTNVEYSHRKIWNRKK